jgi:D-alanyl-D-alanine carboxypeptidase (penicillin-binding protein 5/6)
MPIVMAGLADRVTLFARLTLLALPLCFGPALPLAQAKPQPAQEGKQAALAPAKDGRAAEASGPSTQGTTISALPGMETSAPTAILIDAETGTVLLEKNADQLTPPASLTKLMTMAVVFEQLKTGKLRLDDEFTVSQNAWRKGGASSGGSTMFLPLNGRASVRSLIQGTAIQSGNDATIVLAEGLAGSEDGFARMMNENAKAIGITKSTFRNPHGLPDPEQRVTMRDLATLASHIVRDYPGEYKVFSEPQFTFNGITQQNRNPVLGLVEGVDGMKTGHTAESGYGLVASAIRNGQRLILALNGLKSANERRDEARKLLEWGFRGFEQATLVPAGQTVSQVRVVSGAVSSVPLVPLSDAKVLKPKGTGQGYGTKVVADERVQAPVRKGDRLGTLQVTANGSVIREVPLVAGADVDLGAWWQRAWESVTDRVRKLI